MGCVFAVGGRFLSYGKMKRLLLKMLGFRVQGGIEFHPKMAQEPDGTTSK